MPPHTPASALPGLSLLAALALAPPRCPGISPDADPCRPQPTEAVRCRCGGALSLYRRGPDGAVERLHDGAWAEEGDLLQLAYTSSGTHGTILSLDGRGLVTRHLPSSPHATHAAALTQGSLSVLDHGLQLDDAPGFERFYLVLDDAPFALLPLETQLSRCGALTSERTVDTLELRKLSPRRSDRLRRSDAPWRVLP